jgi:AcrR family transcriptional regulator
MMVDRSGSTKQRIFDTMVDLMGQRGYQGVSVDEIAAETGIAKGTIYYHYKGKAEMMEALMLDRLTPVIQDLGEAVKSADEDACVVLQGIVDIEFDFLMKQHSFARLLLTELWREDRGWKYTIFALRDQLVKVFGEVLKNGKDQGVFKKDLPIDYTGAAIFGIVATTVLNHIIFNPTRSVDEERANMMYIVMNSVTL